MNDVTKLPKWAQKKISDLERKVNELSQALNDGLDEQDESPFWHSVGYSVDMIHKKRFIPARNIEVEMDGNRWSILARDGELRITWDTNRVKFDDIVVCPKACNSIVLKPIKRLDGLAGELEDE